MTSPFYDPKKFLLPHDLDKELIQQTLEIFDFVLGDSEFSLDQDKDLKQMLIDTLDKYRDVETISIDAVKERIKEQGYAYLLDVFEVSDDNLRVLASYLPLIQIMKGTRPGLELIFTILNVGFEIKEWWEDPSNLEILSYILFVELVNQPITTTIVPRLKEFSRQYVYPLLTHIVYAILYKFNKTPYIGAVAYTKTAITVWQEILWLIWSGDGAPENVWTDQKPYQDPEEHRSLWQGTPEEELIWDPNNDETATDIINTWSSTDNSSIRAWMFKKPELMTDENLLEWWIDKVILTGGKPEESWSTEDKTVEDPIITYWCPDTDANLTGIVRLTIIANPARALIEINGELTSTAEVKRGSKVSYRVYDPEGKYTSKSAEITIVDDTILTITLDQSILNCTLTIVPNVETAAVFIETHKITDDDLPTENNARTEKSGNILYWKVTARGYYPQEGSVQLTDSDITLNVNLEDLPIYTLTINPTPADAVVRMNGEVRNSMSVFLWDTIEWDVNAVGYYEKTGSTEMLEDTTLDVVLEELPWYTFTINPTPADATVRIDGVERKSVRVQLGMSVEYSVTRANYMPNSGSVIITSDRTLDVVLEKASKMLCYYTPNASDAFKCLYIYRSSSSKVGDNIYSSAGGSINSAKLATTVRDLSSTYKTQNSTNKYLKITSQYPNEVINTAFEGEDSNLYGITPIRYPKGDLSAEPTLIASGEFLDRMGATLGIALIPMYQDSLKTSNSNGGLKVWDGSSYFVSGPCEVTLKAFYRIRGTAGQDAISSLHQRLLLYYGTSPSSLKTKAFDYDRSNSNITGWNTVTGTLELASDEKFYYIGPGTGLNGGITVGASLAGTIGAAGSFYHYIEVWA